MKLVNSRPISKNWVGLNGYIIPDGKGSDVNDFHNYLNEIGYRKPEIDKEDAIFLYGASGYFTGGIEKNDERLIYQIPIINEIAYKVDYFTEMIIRMLDYLSPYMDRGAINNSATGCSCGIHGSPPWREDIAPSSITVMSTIDSAQGCVEGIVRALGSCKLHALGIHCEDWDEMYIGNTKKKLYNNPSKFDTLIPMGGVLHSELSYIYATKYTAECLRIVEEGNFSFYMDIESLRKRQAFNLKTVGNGIHILRDHFIPGDSKALINILTGYAEEIWDEGYISLGNNREDYDWMPEDGGI